MSWDSKLKKTLYKHKPVYVSLELIICILTAWGLNKLVSILVA